jgi:hypothetical protein
VETLLRARGPLLAASIICLSGCFRYVPTRLEVAPVGENVRLVVTRQGAFELSEVTGVSAAAPVLSGALVRVEDRAVLLRIPLESQRMGIHTEELGQTIRVPAEEILSVERRELDRTLTGLLAAGSAAAAVGVIFMIMDSFGNSDLPDGPYPIESVISFPLVSFGFGS